jgi:hypothetical protein
MRVPLLVPLLAAATAAAAAPAAPAPCFAMLDGDTPLETPCYAVLFEDGEGLEVRQYTGGATLVTDAQPGNSSYDSALTETATFVILYFTGEANEQGENLLASRTVPLFLSTPTASNGGAFVGGMAIAPSTWPANTSFPTPTYGNQLTPLNATVASLHAQFPQAPGEADFEGVCAELAARLKVVGGWRVLPASPFTPTHARYYSENKGNTLPWEGECWMGVRPHASDSDEVEPEKAARARPVGTRA